MIRDVRTGGWFWMANEVLDEHKLSGARLTVYAWLCRLANNDRQALERNVSRIAEAARLNRETARIALDDLAKLGLIDVDGETIKLLSSGGKSVSKVAENPSVSGGKSATHIRKKKDSDKDSNAKPRQARLRNLVFDAIVKASYGDLPTIPKSVAGHVGKASSTLRALLLPTLSEKEAAALIPQFAAWWGEAHEGFALTPGVIEKHLPIWWAQVHRVTSEPSGTSRLTVRDLRAREGW